MHCSMVDFNWPPQCRKAANRAASEDVAVLEPSMQEALDELIGGGAGDVEPGGEEPGSESEGGGSEDAATAEEGEREGSDDENAQFKTPIPRCAACLMQRGRTGRAFNTTMC
jgi:hypothetical protein